MLAIRANLEAMAGRFETAVCPEDVFGKLSGAAPDKLQALKSQFRSFSRACHPDLACAGDKELATKVFQALSKWEERARYKIEQDTYGDGEPFDESAPPYNPVELTVRGKLLRLTGLIAEGTFASVHAAEYDNDREHSIFAKYARDPEDNDLLEREYRVLKSFQIPSHNDRADEERYNKHRKFVPFPILAFSILDESYAKHRANLLRIPRGRCYTAEKLLKDKFPGGIPAEHVWWIFRRLLLAAWMAHSRGYVHGAITPDHILIYPEAHGIVLVDWTCAAKIEEEHVGAFNPAYQRFYPPELLRKEPAMPSADIYMAAATAVCMLGGDPADRFIPVAARSAMSQSLLSCLDPIARRRPQNAGLYHNEFRKLLGKRAFAEMVVP